MQRGSVDDGLELGRFLLGSRKREGGGNSVKFGLHDLTRRDCGRDSTAQAPTRHGHLGVPATVAGTGTYRAGDDGCRPGMLARQRNRDRQQTDAKQGDACGFTTNFKHAKGSRMGQHNAARSGERRKVRGHGVAGAEPRALIKIQIRCKRGREDRSAGKPRRRDVEPRRETRRCNCKAMSTLYVRKNK